MNQSGKPPLWVQLAFSNIKTKKGARILIAVTAVFTLYCIPWAPLEILPPRLAGLFLITDWSWFAMMLPITVWYWLCLRWMDVNSAWDTAANTDDSIK